MKFSGKKILALIIALMMCSTMVSAFATETETETTTPSIAITSVKVLNSASDTEAAELVGDGGVVGAVSLTPEQLLQVTATVTGVEDAQVSFMSYKSGATEYSNSTIQYLDQTGAPQETATFTFRPRMENDTFVAMTGATTVTTAASFNYTVTAASADMVVTGNKTYYANAIVDTTLTIHAPIASIASVKIGDTTLATDKYTVSTADSTTTITISKEAIPTEVGTYTVTISAEGYNDATATINIIAALENIEDENKGEAEAAVEGAAATLDTATKDDNGAYVVDISDQTANVGEVEKTITFKVESLGAGVVEQDGKLVFDAKAENAPFVGKATVNVIMAANVSVTKEVYIIPEGTTISYGNVTALTGTDGKSDAFKLALTGTETDDEKAKINDDFKTWCNDDENKSKVKDAEMKALAIGAGRADVDTIAAASDTLDFNKKDGISLNEYNIYRKMIGGFSGFGIVEVNAERAKYNQ